MPYKDPEKRKAYNQQYHKKYMQLEENQIKQQKNFRNWKYNNPEGYYLARRDVELKRKYGISLEEYNTILENQGNVCAICSNPETEISYRRCKKGQPLALAVDHNHATENIRGILCGKCNRMIGFLEEKGGILILDIIKGYLENG